MLLILAQRLISRDIYVHCPDKTKDNHFIEQVISPTVDQHLEDNKRNSWLLLKMLATDGKTDIQATVKWKGILSRNLKSIRIFTVPNFNYVYFLFLTKLFVPYFYKRVSARYELRTAESTVNITNILFHKLILRNGRFSDFVQSTRYIKQKDSSPLQFVNYFPFFRLTADLLPQWWWTRKHPPFKLKPNYLIAWTLIRRYIYYLCREKENVLTVALLNSVQKLVG